MKEIIAHEEKKLNLLGLILRNFFTAVLFGNDEKKKEILNKLEGNLMIKAGKMGAHVSFGEKIIISNLSGKKDNNAWLIGDLGAFVSLMAKKGFIKYVLNRRIKFGGNIFLLLNLLRIIR